ncbi:hypothetical protein V8E36_001706 [Tilletia maclaganii]
MDLEFSSIEYGDTDGAASTSKATPEDNDAELDFLDDVLLGEVVVEVEHVHLQPSKPTSRPTKKQLGRSYHKGKEKSDSGVQDGADDPDEDSDYDSAEPARDPPPQLKRKRQISNSYLQVGQSVSRAGGETLTSMIAPQELELIILPTFVLLAPLRHLTQRRRPSRSDNDRGDAPRSVNPRRPRRMGLDPPDGIASALSAPPTERSRAEQHSTSSRRKEG